MFTLKNSELTVSVLDPKSDRDKLGSRYCTGGYIWQIEDAKRGPLLSGPCYPGPTNAFDGQGAPEVFEITLGSDTAQVGEEVCGLGVGRVLRSSPLKPFHVRDNFTVNQFVDWTIEATDAEIRMTCEQVFQDYQVSLIKTVRLQNRAVESRTEIRNAGKPTLPVRWFAHPFFPLSEILCRFSRECDVPANPGFTLGEDGWLRRRAEHEWNRGCFQALQFCFGYPLRVEQKHPLLGSVEVDCDFALAALPIWGNARTFSLEPYFHTILPSGAEAQWSIHYRF